MVAGSLLNFDWTVAIMLFWLLASLLFIFLSPPRRALGAKNRIVVSTMSALPPIKVAGGSGGSYGRFCRSSGDDQCVSRLF